MDENKEKKKKKHKWILPGITLRIVSKEYRDGRYFEDLGDINDIMDSRTFSFVTKRGEILEDLEEKHLETVMPKAGQRVIILKGPNRGTVGIMTERNKKENTVLVKVETNSIEFIKMTQDDCSASSI